MFTSKEYVMLGWLGGGGSHHQTSIKCFLDEDPDVSWIVVSLCAFLGRCSNGPRWIFQTRGNCVERGKSSRRSLRKKSADIESDCRWPHHCSDLGQRTATGDQSGRTTKIFCHIFVLSDLSTLVYFRGRAYSI